MIATVGLYSTVVIAAIVLQHILLSIFVINATEDGFTQLHIVRLNVGNEKLDNDWLILPTAGHIILASK